MNKIIEWAKALRLVEIIGKLGFVLVGAFFAIQDFSWEVVFVLAKISTYSFICALAIFCFNSYTGYNADKNNQRLVALFLLSKPQWLWLTCVFWAISLVIVLVHPLPVMFTALLVLVFWVIYSMPHYGLKGIPFGGIFVSFFTELLLFHLSYFFFAPYSLASITIATYFGLLVAAGHSMHELIDYEADKKDNIQTTAVYFGLDKAKRFPFLIFTFAFGLLIGCFYWQFFSVFNFVCLAVANIATLFLSYRLFYSLGNLPIVRFWYLTFYVLALLLIVIIG